MAMAVSRKSSGRAVGRPARIFRDDAADAALAIGLDVVKMKTVGERLGVNHSSLYRHFKSRDDLILLALDRAVNQLDWDSDSPDWREFLRFRAEALWELCARYPGLASVLRAMKTIPPSVTAGYARACQRLEEHGFATDDAVLVFDSIMDMTVDSASRWEQLLENDGAAAERMLDSLSSGSEGSAQRYGSRMKDLLSGDPQDWWYSKLNLLILGAESLRRRGD